MSKRKDELQQGRGKQPVFMLVIATGFIAILIVAGVTVVLEKLNVDNVDAISNVLTGVVFILLIIEIIWANLHNKRIKRSVKESLSETKAFGLSSNGVQFVMPDELKKAVGKPISGIGSFKYVEGLDIPEQIKGGEQIKELRCSINLYNTAISLTLEDAWNTDIAAIIPESSIEKIRLVVDKEYEINRGSSRGKTSTVRVKDVYLIIDMIDGGKIHTFAERMKDLQLKFVTNKLLNHKPDLCDESVKLKNLPN